jgi:hypothetical protein
MLKGLTSKQENELNQKDLTANRSQLGTRIKEAESVGMISYSYSSGHVDKTIAETDLPISSIVKIVLSSADAAANLILPAEINKLYVIVNSSGQAITVKVTGQTGITVANAKTAILTSSGTDIVRVTADI